MKAPKILLLVMFCLLILDTFDNPLLAQQSAQQAPFPLHGKTVIRFADASQGGDLIAKRDHFVKAMSPFDRQARLQTDQNVTTEQHLQFVRRHTRSWTDDERGKILESFKTVQKRLKGLRDVFPPVVWLVKTSGREEAGAAYCRGSAIVLPAGMLNRRPEMLQRLLMHELFHILSSHNPALRKKLYALVGFHAAGNVIDLPDSLKDRKMTNPDAPLFDQVIELEHDGENLTATPILYSADKYDPQKEVNMFRYLQFHLMVVTKENGRWRPATKGGEPWLLDPKTTPSYHRQIGKNTGYIVHPDEILADNFVHLLMNAQDLPTPAIVQAAGKILRTQP